MNEYIWSSPNPNVIKSCPFLLQIYLYDLFILIVFVTVLAELWPVLERCTVISKKAVKYFGTFGLASWLWGTIFIDRVNGKEAQNAINSTTEIIKKRKVNIKLSIILCI